MFWIISILLLFLAAAFIVLPLLRSVPDAVVGQSERDRANLAIFEERLGELEHDLSSGALDEEQFIALKQELERSLLSDVSEAEAVAPHETASTHARRWLSRAALLPLLAILMVIPASYYLYGIWGFRDDLAVAELFERSQNVGEDPQQIIDIIMSLGEVVEEDPKNGWAWYYMGRHLVTLGQLQEAGLMFERAAENIDNPLDQAVVLGQYAQTAYLAADRQMTDEVRNIISRTQRLNPNEPNVLQLLGADAFINEDFQGAITYWQQLLTLSPNEEERQFLRSVIADAQQMLAENGGAATGELAAESGGPHINVDLALAPGVELPATARIFISAQNPQRPGPPLAAKVLTAADLPGEFTLTNADAVGGMNLSSAEAVLVVATASLAGTADVQSGDYQVRSEILALDPESEAVSVQLVIEDPVP